MPSPLLFIRRFAVGLFVVLALLGGLTWVYGGQAAAQDATSPANKLFVQAMQLLQEADATLDSAKEAQLLREIDRLLRDIVNKYPDSGLAVQLMSNQFVGDFDYYEFRGRVEALVCESPLSSLCFVYRISEMLPPVETPIVNARWDWLSLAVSYHQLGQSEKAKEIISPFAAAIRRGSSADGSGQDFFVARALALIGESAQALSVTRAISDCSTRIYNLSDIGKAAKWRGDDALSKNVAEEARGFAESNQCVWETGLVIQGLHRVGRTEEAKRLLARSIAQQVGDFRNKKENCCPPELAVAAAEIDSANTALNLLRVVEEENPWTAPAVLGRIARRGEFTLAVAYAEQIADVDLRGEALAELVAAAMERNDKATAEDAFARLAKMTNGAGARRPVLLVQRAKAERSLYRDEGWRSAFQAALNAAERASNFVRRDAAAPLLAALMRIETGLPMLD